MNHRQELRQVIMRHFNTSELRVICFDLNLDDENLSKSEKTTFVIEIIKFCERTNRMSELYRKCEELRPEINFAEPNTNTNIKHELGVATRHLQPYLESQFKAYAEVWKSLQGLRFAGNEIWERLTDETMKSFLVEWIKIQRLAADSEIYFEPDDYKDLRRLLNAMGDFRIGKSRLYEMYQRFGRDDERSNTYLMRSIHDATTWAKSDLVQQINENEGYKHQYETLLDRIGNSFRLRLAAIP